MRNNNLMKLGLVILLAVITSTVMGANGCMWVGHHNGDALASGSSGIIYKVVAPFPPDGANDVPLNTILSWTRTFSATGYDVYFSTNNPPDFQTTITSTNGVIITPIRNGYYDFRIRYNPGTLTYGTTYYWRIDPKGDTELTTGDVWTFTTIKLLPPPPAILPFPPNNAQFVPVNTELSWAGPTGITSYAVYFGKNNPPDFQVNCLPAPQQAGPPTVYRTRYVPSTVDYGTTYYWRIDSNNDAGTTAGRLWQFQTIAVQPPARPLYPFPPNNAGNMPIIVQLSWDSAYNAASYDVYFGTGNPPDFKANVLKTLFRTRYNPGPLNYGTTYYWRVDAKNDVGTTTGTVWQFTTVIQLPPPRAILPLPPNNANSVPVNSPLTWSYAGHTDYYDVYFGTQITQINFQTTITNTNIVPLSTSNINPFRLKYDPGTLSYGTTYYWRIDTRNVAGTTTGTPWTFITLGNANGAPPSAATKPATNVTAGSPASGAGSATLNGTVNPNGLQTAVYFQINTFDVTLYGGLPASGGAKGDQGTVGPGAGAAISFTGGTITPLQYIPAGTTPVDVTYDLSNLTANTYYAYRCFATNQLGTGYGFYVVLAIPPGGGGTKPNAPSALSTTAISYRQVNLAWTDNSQDELGFVIERSLDGISFTYLWPINIRPLDLTVPPPPQVPANVTTFTDFTVTGTTTYYYRVFAVNQAGKSDSSNVVQVTTPAAPGDLIPPTRPVSLTAVIYPSATSPQIILNWVAATDNVGVAGYRIFRAAVGAVINPSTPPQFGAPYAIVPARAAAGGDGSTTTYLDTNVSSPNFYVYAVYAFDAAGNVSPLSNLAGVRFVAGTVVDSDGAPVEGAVVVAGASSPQALTDVNGQFYINDVPEGNQRIDVIVPGFYTANGARVNVSATTTVLSPIQIKEVDDVGKAPVLSDASAAITDNVIYVTATINPGSDGDQITNARAELIGYNTGAVLSATGLSASGAGNSYTAAIPMPDRVYGTGMLIVILAIDSANHVASEFVSVDFSGGDTGLYNLSTIAGLWSGTERNYYRDEQRWTNARIVVSGTDVTGALAEPRLLLLELGLANPVEVARIGGTIKLVNPLIGLYKITLNYTGTNRTVGVVMYGQLDSPITPTNFCGQVKVKETLGDLPASGAGLTLSYRGRFHLKKGDTWRASELLSSPWVWSDEILSSTASSGLYTAPFQYNEAFTLDGSGNCLSGTNTLGLDINSGSFAISSTTLGIFTGSLVTSDTATTSFYGLLDMRKKHVRGVKMMALGTDASYGYFWGSKTGNTPHFSNNDFSSLKLGDDTITAVFKGLLYANGNTYVIKFRTDPAGHIRGGYIGLQVITGGTIGFVNPTTGEFSATINVLGVAPNSWQTIYINPSWDTSRNASMGAYKERLVGDCELVTKGTDISVLPPSAMVKGLLFMHRLPE